MTASQGARPLSLRGPPLSSGTGDTGSDDGAEVVSTAIELSSGVHRNMTHRAKPPMAMCHRRGLTPCLLVFLL
jgi:hypothetical protein